MDFRIWLCSNFENKIEGLAGQTVGSWTGLSSTCWLLAWFKADWAEFSFFFLKS
jgi:hypothetical protein